VRCVADAGRRRGRISFRDTAGGRRNLDDDEKHEADQGWSGGRGRRVTTVTVDVDTVGQ